LNFTPKDPIREMQFEVSPTAQIPFGKSPIQELLCNYVGVKKKIVSERATLGLPIYPYVTYAQKKVAKAMTDVAIEKNVKYVLSVGDNIYFTGVSNEYDSRFQTSFEDIYNTDALRVPWYLIAGNHDHFGNVSAQVAYSRYSRKWNFPDLYYKLSFHIKNTTIDVLMLDTIVLCGNTADIQNGGFFDMLWNRSHDPEGPSDVEKAEKQWKWIKFQHIVYPGVGGHEIHYVLSGAASRSDRSKANINTLTGRSLKFRSFIKLVRSQIIPRYKPTKASTENQRFGVNQSLFRVAYQIKYRFSIEPRVFK
uniref:Metallophos domain-containing protein n=1 Tax=Haemonchus placei TaxID=6290 RepID=A0A158QP04_HAEPC